MKFHPINRSTGRESERWKTTSESALHDVAEKLTGNYDNAGRIRNMQNRKMANNTTSINFGNESVNYISDAAENQAACFGGDDPGARARQKERIKKMKADLTTTNFMLGDERPDYISTNSEAMAAAESFKGTKKVAMNEDLKEAVKKSSLHFGNEIVSYATVGQESMKYHGNQNDFQKIKDEIKEHTATLRKHNFVLGDEQVNYVSDYQQGYGSMPVEAYKQAGQARPRIKETILDARLAHFSLGQDKVLYQSNNQFAAESIQGKSALSDLAKQRERSKHMKAELVKTSIVIGDDATYF